MAIGGHEGATCYILDRSSWLRTDKSGFGGGHVMLNRIVYNSATDSWGKWAWTDGSEVRPPA